MDSEDDLSDHNENIDQDDLHSKDNDGDDYHDSMTFTNFLFGNIDDNGELIDGDFLDNETKKHLRSLDRLGVSLNILRDIKGDDNESVDSDEKASSPKDEEQRAESAVDYFDINELLEEIPEEEEKFRQALSMLQFKMPTAPVKVSQPSKPKTSSITPAHGSATASVLNEDDDYDSWSDEKISKKDSKSDEKTKADDSEDQDDDDDDDDDDDKDMSIDKNGDSLMNGDGENGMPRKKLETPLAAMLPSKYADCDVTDLFPEFRHNKVLRFSRLFGPSKPMSLTQIWKTIKNKKKRKKILQLLKLSNSQELEEFERGLKLSEQNGDIEALTKPVFQLNIRPAGENDAIESDEEDRIAKQPIALRDYPGQELNRGGNENKPKVADWRYGPAQFWYDMIGVPESGDDIFDYGFSLLRDSQDSIQNLFNRLAPDEEDDCYHMVTQMQWEDEIIWNGDEVKAKILAKLNEKYHAAGWIPSGRNRTATSFTQQVRGSMVPSAAQVTGAATAAAAASAKTSSVSGRKAEKMKLAEQNGAADKETDIWYSIFPVENDELVYGVWEDDVIWDSEAMPKIPEPRVLTLDPNDENIVLGIPDDIDPNEVRPKETQPIPLKEKKEHHLKKSRILLGKAGVIAEPEPESPPPPPSMERDPFNVSNDEFYNAKLTQDTALKPTVGGNLIQHSIPALELRQPFFPTFMGMLKLRSFHRPALKRFSHGVVADTLPHGVIPLLKHMKKKAKQREQERLASGGGEMFFMRTPEDLSGKDGDLILAEFSEEHPPLVMQVGMATKIKNYYKRKPGKDGGVPEHKYGELAYAHTSPFLGNLALGQSLQALENNLFRAPIYEHRIPDSDFLVIRTRNNYFIREVENIFTVGQILPLSEVPGPNSKKANNFIRDFLQVFIYRLFWRSTDNPKRIKMEDIKKAFPSHSESSIRKRLKLCADFKRTGNGSDSNWWVLKNEFRLPTEDEMRAMVSPEQCCAYYSMLAAEQRLKDAGYGERFLFSAEDENDEDLQLKMDDEVKAAPWNTTRAFIAAMKGKCLLQLNGVADPTGCGEGFSYIRIPNKPQISKEEGTKDTTPKKTVTGTDADLRRLPLNQAKNLLRKYGVPEEEIKRLSRWEVIDVVRTLSTEKAKAGSEQMSKFARGNRFSIAEHQERYKGECQRIFELQNRILSSNEVLSTDEEESEEEDLDIEEMGKNIENILSNKKTSQQLSMEKEEAERKEFQKFILGEDSNSARDDLTGKKKGLSGQRKESEPDDSMNFSSKGRLLKIYRTFRNADGKEYVRIETVRKPAVIEAYVKIRETKDSEYIKRFVSSMDENAKDDVKREKRRLQEQLRRLKKADKERPGGGPSTSSFGLGESNFGKKDGPMKRAYEDEDGDYDPVGKKEKKPKKIKEVRMKCGACGAVGHMKTNRACPLYNGGDPMCESYQVAMTEEQEEQEGRAAFEEDDLVKIDETKVVLSMSLIKRAEDLKRKAIVLKVPKEAMNIKRRRRAGTIEHCDYLQKPEYKSANRRRTDPLVTLGIVFEEICSDFRSIENSQIFWTPVNAKQVPDYFKIVSKPMDIQTIRKKNRDRQYTSRQAFLCDVKQMLDNSILYNGVNHGYTVAAQRMYDLSVERLQERDEKLTKLEKSINPLLDNDRVAFSYILEQIVNHKLKNVPDSRPFHKPVNKKLVKNYYEVIKSPMDLDTISANIKEHKYHSRDEFLSDIELIYKNSAEYNGEDSEFTKKAAEILELAIMAVREMEEQLTPLEMAISESKEYDDDGDSESVGGRGSRAEMLGDKSRDGIDDSSWCDMSRDSDHRSGSVAAASDTKEDEDDEDDEDDDDEGYYFHRRKVLSSEDGSETEMHIEVSHIDRQVPGGFESEMQIEMSGGDRHIPSGEGDETFDENYDPSEFLMSKFKRSVRNEPTLSSRDVQSSEERENISVIPPINEDLKKVGESSTAIGDEEGDEKNDDDDDIWF